MKKIRKSIITVALSIILFCMCLQGCNPVKHIDIVCRPLTDYNRISTVDYNSLDYVLFDSIQYRDHILSYRDTTESSVIEGQFLLEKCYYFDNGLVLIVNKDSIRYEVIIVTGEKETVKVLTPRRYYLMRIKPYFRFEENTLGSDVRKEIYHNHYVIYPAYLLRDEMYICTAELEDIVLVHNDR